MHKLTSGALVVALTGTAVTVPATINPTAHYAEAQGLLGLGGQALQGLVEKGEAKVAELESQLWKADLALKGAQAVLEMKRWGVVLAIGEENKKAKQAEYDQQKLLVDSAELLVRTTKTSLDAARKTLAVTKKQLEDFNGKDPSAYEDAPEPDIKPVALPTNLREALESITAQQEAVAKRQALFDEADSAYTKRKKEVDSSWFSWLAPSNTKELEGLKNRRDARKAKLDLEQARLDNITRSIELFETVEAATPSHEGHGADRYDATTPTNIDDASRQLEFANSTLEAATHRKANIEANLAALTGWQERNPFTGFWHNADKWTLERALRAVDNEITDATKRIADKAAALEELKNAPAETEPSAPEGVEPSETETAEPSATVEPSAAAEPTEESAPRTPEPSESEAPTTPESPATSSEESAPRTPETPETTEPTTDLSTATSTPATTSTSTPEEFAPRTPEASESVEPADTSAEPEDQIDIDELTHNLDEAKKLEQDMLDLQKLLQQYINKPEAETTEPSETEVTPTTVTEVSAATPAPATTSAPTSSEVSAARTTPTEIPSSQQSAPRTTEAAKPGVEVSAATSTPATTSTPTSEVSAARTTTSAKLSTVAVAPTTSSEVSAARTTEETEPTAEDSAARTTPTEIPSSQQSAPRTTEAAKPGVEVSAATSTPATTSAPTSSEVSAARTTEETEPTAESSAPRTTSQAPETTQQAKPTQQTEGAASGAEGSSASSWLWLILPLLLALGFGGAAYADLIPGVRLPRM
ncbi:hypothetical protein [Corynebacterium sp. UMB10321]|uniref:hypothetical protein n=1 Tax=Corynebacterium sp. UMB10321 TaxID=3046312 RepID=UPI00254D1BB0|nr:hypothetical protein [Corynebacterium sp. UMB10321]MDK8244003.1 hypothetical protein [Corynebacterium sp. UMB10321]